MKCSFCGKEKQKNVSFVSLEDKHICKPCILKAKDLINDPSYTHYRVVNINSPLTPVSA
jgi:hypothetical protein